MSQIALREIRENIAKFNLKLGKPSFSDGKCRGIDIIEKYLAEHDPAIRGGVGKVSIDVVERVTGFNRIIRHYLDDMESVYKRHITKDYLTIAVCLFNRAEDHGITSVQRALKKARVELEKAQKDKKHWIWKEGVLK